MPHHGTRQPVVPHLNVRNDARGRVDVVHVRIGEVDLHPPVFAQARGRSGFVLLKGAVPTGSSSGYGVGERVRRGVACFWSFAASDEGLAFAVDRAVRQRDRGGGFQGTYSESESAPYGLGLPRNLGCWADLDWSWVQKKSS